jgi:hypothetical protein
LGADVSLVLPYVADVKVGGEWQRNCEVRKLNAKTVRVKLKDGSIICLHATKDRHKFEIKFVSTEVR